MKHVTLVYHRKDMDGFTSGAIARRYFQTAGYIIREIPFDYNDDFPQDLIGGTIVIFMDVVIQPYSMMRVLQQKYKVIVIDHHKTWIDNEWAKDFLGHTSTEKSGCMLTWEYFYPKEPMPKLVEMLGKFDIWDHSDEKLWKDMLVPVNLAALAQNIHPSIKRPGEPIVNFLDVYLNDYFKNNNRSEDARTEELAIVGRQIWNYVYLDDAQTASAAACDCIFDGHPAIAINSRRN